MTITHEQAIKQYTKAIEEISNTIRKHLGKEPKTFLEQLKSMSSEKHYEFISHLTNSYTQVLKTMNTAISIGIKTTEPALIKCHEKKIAESIYMFWTIVKSVPIETLPVIIRQMRCLMEIALTTSDN